MNGRGIHWNERHLILDDMITHKSDSEESDIAIIDGVSKTPSLNSMIDYRAKQPESHEASERERQVIGSRQSVFLLSQAFEEIDLLHQFPISVKVRRDLLLSLELVDLSPAFSSLFSLRGEELDYH